MIVPAAPFQPVPMLILASPLDSELLVFLEGAHRLIEGCPSLVVRVESELDAHGRAKKALRLADAEWKAARSLPLPGQVILLAAVDAAQLRLLKGRPRTSGYVVLMALLLRGYFGAGFKASDVTTMMVESITLHVFLTNLDMTMPGRSTLTELINVVSNETRCLILDAQCAQALRLGLDDFSTMLQDSTHVAGNTAWPTDSRTMVALVTRALRVGASLARVHLPVIRSRKASGHLGAMVGLDREIDMSKGKVDRTRSRRRRYEKLLWRARRLLGILRDEIVSVEAALGSLDVRPSEQAVAARAVARLRADIEALAKVISHCEARVVDETKVPMAEKILSVSDPDVGFIAKGQRDPVIGYKPQIARSGEGFITGLLLPRGNASDSGQLVPMVDEVTRRTGIVPSVLSVDDGYASQANMDAMKARRMKVISINGSKGKALTARADWTSDAYVEARDMRSAVESLMFTIKQGFNFGEVARRGLDAVHGELLEKAIAYNLCHAARIVARTASPRAVDEDSVPRAA